MWFLRLIKNFVNAEGTTKAIILGIISLIVVLGFIAADFFWQFQPQTTAAKVTYNAFLIILGLSSFYVFCIGIKYVWIDRKDWNWQRRHDWQITSAITGACGITAGWALTNLAATVCKTFLEIEIPSVTLWYALIPGAFILALAILSFIWKFVSRWIRNMWEKLKDAWYRA